MKFCAAAVAALLAAHTYAQTEVGGASSAAGSGSPLLPTGQPQNNTVPSQNGTSPSNGTAGNGSVTPPLPSGNNNATGLMNVALSL